MTRKTLVGKRAWIFLVLATFSFVLGPSETMAQEDRIVRVYGDFASDKPAATKIEPEEVWAGKGTTVVWKNNSMSEIKIVFPKGRECEEATEAAIHWKLDAKACYVTGHMIPPGGTISAVFNRVGRYEYEIEYVEKGA